MEQSDTMKQMKRTADLAPCGIGLYDLKASAPVFLNRAYYDMVGYTEEEYQACMEDKGFLIFPHNPNVPRRKRMEFEKPWEAKELEYRMVRKDGQVRWIKLDSATVTLDGKDYAFISFMDITKEKNSYAQLTMIAENTNNAVSILKVSKKTQELVYANTRFFHVMGIDRKTYGKKICKVNTESVTASDYKRIRDVVHHALYTGASEEIEHQMIQPNGTCLWLSTRIRAIQQDINDSFILISITTDITEKKEAELRAALEQRRFQLVVDEMNAAVFEWDWKTGSFYSSAAYQKYVLSRMNAAAFLDNHNIAPAVHPDDHQMIDDFFQQAQSGRDRAEVLLRLKLVDGRFHWCRMICFYHRDAAGKPTQTIGVIIDVNQEHERAFMMSHLLNSMPGGVGIFVFAERLYCNFYSDGFAKMAGISRKEMDAKIENNTVLSSIIAPVDYPNVAPVFAEYTAKGLPLNLTCRYIYGDGSIHWLHLSAEKMGEQNGKPVYYCVFTKPTDEAALYRNITEDSANGVIVVEKNRRVVLYANYAAARYYGLSTTAELIGQPLSELLAKYEKNTLLTINDINLLRRDTYTEFHVEQQGAFLAVRAKALQWNGVDSYILYISDETKERQNAIRQDTMLASIPGGPAVYRVKKDGRVVPDFLSKGFASILDYENTDELIARCRQNAMDEIPPEDGKTVMKHVMECLSNHTPVSVAYNVYTKNHEKRTIRMDANVMESTQLNLNDLAVLYAVHTLVSKDTQIALAEQHRYRDLMNALDIALLEWDKESGFYASEKYQEYALSRQEFHRVLTNTADISVVHPDDLAVLNDFFALYGQRRKRTSTTLRMKMIDDSYRWTEMLGFYEFGEDGHICRVIGILRDIDKERMEQNERLRIALEEAKKANQAKTAFLSRVSHDMRTPLNGILGLTALMKDAENSPNITQDLAQLELSGKYLLGLINDTLDVSRIENGKLELHPTVCDNREILNNILRLTRVNIKSKHIHLELDTDRFPHTYIYADEGRLEQIAMNILGNAVKFTPDGGTIRCLAEIRSVKDGIVTGHFIVTDTGCGMSQEFLPHLFEAFSQENATTTNANQGTGLGMSITKRLVELMNGEITAESKLGTGTSFDVVLRLPIATEEQVKTWHGTQNPHDTDYHLKGKRVLLCEDHPLNTKIATRILEKKGILVEHAENGQAAVEHFNACTEGYYDAILMDIRMPVMDGIDATKTIRAMSRADAHQIPILAMTANALEEDVKQTREAGMDAHLSKPIEPERLYAVLEGLIQQHGSADAFSLS